MFNNFKKSTIFNFYFKVKCQHHLTDKRELRASLSEIQKTNSENEVEIATGKKTNSKKLPDENLQFQGPQCLLCLFVRSRNCLTYRLSIYISISQLVEYSVSNK